MGYFKRKQTKKKGKRGTKKYRGGANAANSANAELVTKFGELKPAFDTLISDPTKENFTKVDGLMNDVGTAFNKYKAMVFPEPAAGIDSSPPDPATTEPM